MAAFFAAAKQDRVSNVQRYVRIAFQQSGDGFRYVRIQMHQRIALFAPDMQMILADVRITILIGTAAFGSPSFGSLHLKLSLIL